MNDEESIDVEVAEVPGRVGSGAVGWRRTGIRRFKYAGAQCDGSNGSSGFNGIPANPGLDGAVNPLPEGWTWVFATTFTDTPGISFSIPAVPVASVAIV